MISEQAAEMARASRIAQGLPPTVTDPAALARVAELLTGRRPDRLKVEAPEIPASDASGVFTADRISKVST